MKVTRFWLLRHAIVTPEARTYLYGRKDVPICLDSRAAQQPAYGALARTLPAPAIWLVTPLVRTRATAEAIAAAGYDMPPLRVEPGLTEQHLGHWQGLPHAALPPLLREPAHPFWPLGSGETPPEGESMVQVVHRVGDTLERLARDYEGADVVAISHGGAIRAALAHASGAPVAAAMHFAIENLSLTVLERLPAGWRIMGVNITQS